MSNTLSAKAKLGEKKDDTKKIGCKHYDRKCAFVAPCCSKVYTCRVCHDENETHEIDRKLIKKIKCLICQLTQKVHNKCEACNTLFGKYFCEDCRLFDDAEKGQFHCEGCGLCRIGGRENFFHCEKCDMCLSVKLKGHHKCVEESSRRNCAICLEDLHTSRTDGHIPPCGHLIHRKCFEQCVKTGNYACPTCAESLLNMKTVWTQLDAEVATTPMPDEYKEFYVFVLCRDCHKESKVLFHVIGLKCQHCGSYNTCRTANPDEDEANPKATNTANSSTPTGADGAEAQSPVHTSAASSQVTNHLDALRNPETRDGESQQVSEPSSSGEAESVPDSGSTESAFTPASPSNQVRSILTVTLQNTPTEAEPERNTIEPDSKSS